MTFHYSSWLSFVLYSDLCLPIPTDEEFPSSPAFLLSTENTQDMLIEWINFPPIFSLGVKTHSSKWLPEPWFSTGATPTSFNRLVLNLQYQTSSHSSNLQVQEKMPLTQSLWYLFPTYESRTPSESSTSRFSLRQVIEPVWPTYITSTATLLD